MSRRILPPMSDTARSYQTDSPADTTGLDDFFAAEDRSGQPSLDVLDNPVQDKGWTVSEAAQHLQVSEKTILRRLQKGSISGTKVAGQFGLEWRISPSVIAARKPTVVSEQLNPIQNHPQAQDTPAQVVELVQDSTAQDNCLAQDRTVLDRIIDEQKQEIAALRTQLEGAIYRNGYLESKLEDREQQILLLTDSQNKQGWWARFSSWFFRSR